MARLLPTIVAPSLHGTVHGRGSLGWVGERTLRALRDDGFEGVQSGLGASVDPARARAAGLVPFAAVLVGKPGLGVDPHVAFPRLRQQGFEAVTVIAGSGLEADDDAARLVETLLDAEQRAGLPMRLETHRGSVTQDVVRTRRLLARFPSLRLNADFSHWVLTHRLLSWPAEEVAEALADVLPRVRFLHGRVATDDSVQSWPGHPDRAAAEALYAALVRATVEAVERDEPGAVLPFAPELLPPYTGYGAMRPTLPLVELSCRYDESIALVALAQGALRGARGGVA